MGYWLEDASERWLGDLASNAGLADLRARGGALREFLAAGEAAEALVARVVEQVASVPELAYIAALLDGAEAPVFVTDGSESVPDEEPEKASPARTSRLPGRAQKAPADPTLLHRLAARLEPQMRGAFLAAVRGAAGTIDLGSLASAVGAGTPSRVEAAALIGQLSKDLQRRLLPVIGRSFVLGVALGAEVAELDPKLTYGFDLKNPASIQWAREHAADLVTEVMDSTRSGLRALVTASQTEGISPFDLAQEIREVVGLHSRQITAVANFRNRLLGRDVSPAEVRRRVAAYADAQLEWRAMNIARTETITASAEGQEQLWQRAAEAGHLDPTDTARIWTVSKDDRLDETICEPLDGAEAALGEPFIHPDTEDEYQRPPAHPQCLPAGTVIAPGPKITGQTERMYEGKLCIIRTASGQRLAVTPNHPILTSRGWVPAHLTYEAGDVVCSLLAQGMPEPFDLDHQNVPAMIEEIAKAFRCSDRVSAASLPTFREDFHGDGGHGEIAVVRADGALRDGDELALSKHLTEHALVDAAERAAPLDGRGNQEPRGQRCRAAARRLMCRGDLRAPLRRSPPRPLDEFRLGSPSHGFPEIEQSPTDRGAADVKLARELIDGSAGPVAFDEVLSVDFVPFHGLVYNLQTENGWYIANGIIVHNCRCAVVLRVGAAPKKRVSKYSDDQPRDESEETPA